MFESDGLLPPMPEKTFQPTMSVKHNNNQIWNAELLITS